MHNAENMWSIAIIDAKDRLEKLDRESRRLKAAVRMMRQNIREGVPWPVARTLATVSAGPEPTSEGQDAEGVIGQEGC